MKKHGTKKCLIENIDGIPIPHFNVELVDGEFKYYCRACGEEVPDPYKKVKDE